MSVVGGTAVPGKDAPRKRTQFNLNLSQTEMSRLKKLSEDRRIPMVNIIRFALEQLFQQLDGGQLELPLGLESRK